VSDRALAAAPDAALRRLTENEKVCLRRRLVPQTAKEMALDLGISPHAVEKRLKMARTKLGVSSSLAAARLLAASEGYQPLVPQPSELVGAGSSADGSDGAADRPVRRPLARGMMMIAAFGLLAMLAQDMPSTAPTMRKVDMNQAATFLRDAFRAEDTDRSGDLDPRELSALEPKDAARDATLPPAPPAGQADPAAERKWLAKMDRNDDGRVGEAEYIDYMLPWILWQGIPTPR
jgi:DNA-binding CsgD family transcriptional regulator